MYLSTGAERGLFAGARTGRSITCNISIKFLLARMFEDRLDDRCYPFGTQQRETLGEALLRVLMKSSSERPTACCAMGKCDDDVEFE